jgi:hypothetical protein
MTNDSNRLSSSTRSTPLSHTQQATQASTPKQSQPGVSNSQTLDSKKTHKQTNKHRTEQPQCAPSHPTASQTATAPQPTQAHSHYVSDPLAPERPAQTLSGKSYRSVPGLAACAKKCRCKLEQRRLEQRSRPKGMRLASMQQTKLLLQPRDPRRQKSRDQHREAEVDLEAEAEPRGQVEVEDEQEARPERQHCLGDDFLFGVGVHRHGDLVWTRRTATHRSHS